EFRRVLFRSISSRLTREITLNVPIVSAAMDTVTEKEVAIAIARQDGLGFIHKNMTIEQQASQVRAVKRSESGMILDPVTLTPNATIGEAQQIMEEHKIGGIPITEKDGTLVGILTNRDLRFEVNTNRKVYELMTKENLVTVPSDTDLEQAQVVLQKNKIEKLPVVDKDFKVIGLITYKDLSKVKSYPNSCKDTYGRLRVGAAVGVTRDTMDRISALREVDVDVIAVDTAHGHSRGVLDTIRN